VHAEVSLRGTSREPYTLQVGQTRIGTIEPPYLQRELREFLRGQLHQVRLMPMIDNWDPVHERWDTDAIAQALQDPATRSRLVRQLLLFSRANGALGVDVDFEDLPETSAPAVQSFLAELARSARAGHAARGDGALDVPADTYSEKSRPRLVILEAHDQHWPGPTWPARASTGSSVLSSAPATCRRRRWCRARQLRPTTGCRRGRHTFDEAMLSARAPPRSPRRSR
jgi:hypothetical protein